MAKKPKVSPDEYEKQTGALYADIGRIVVHAEQLNYAMSWCCLTILQCQGLPQPYANTVLAGLNLENMRRLWTALMKQHLKGDKKAIEMVSHVSDRIDKANSARNDIVHKNWFIGWGNEETESYEVATGHKQIRDPKKGGTKIKSQDTKHFGELIAELRKLHEIVMRMMGCLLSQAIDGYAKGKFERNFHYVDGKLMPGKEP